MVDSNYLSAYTPSREETAYTYYPPYVNFTQFGDKVRISVRSLEHFNEDKGYHEPKSYATIDICTKEFRELLENALLKLRN